MAAESPQLTRKRLSPGALASLAPDVRRPAYDRAAAGCGIVHLGVGAFMRAHIAVYCDDALAHEGGDWAIAGVSLRRPDVFEQLDAQDGLYMVAIRRARHTDYRLVGSLKRVMVAPRDVSGVVEVLACTDTRIVSVTVTEKGYCVDTRKGGLDEHHPDIVHDLEVPTSPVSLVGLLHAACVERRDREGGALTVLSCDNLPANGPLLRRALLDFAALAGAGLETWIDDKVRFPATMVDRIVPATTEADIAAAARDTGIHDAGLVCTEPFTQWVIEDDFADGRPCWEQAGALLVDDVEPYETAKLRLLNGAHSTIAYLGYLAGYEHVHEVMADATLAEFVERMMQREISPVTPAPLGMEHHRYILGLIDRFRNPSLRHRTWQIAMDGSQKLPQRLLATIRLQLEKSGPIEGLALAIAAWMRYVLGTDEAGRPIDVRDPLAGTFAAIAGDCGRAPGPIIDRFLELHSIFGNALPANDRFRQALTTQLEALFDIGCVATANRYMAGGGAL